MKQFFGFLLFFAISIICDAREIQFNFFDVNEKPLDNIIIKVRKSKIRGTWEQLAGIEYDDSNFTANRSMNFSIDEKAYTLSFCFQKEGYFSEKWEFPVYATDKYMNIEKKIIMVKRVKNEAIIIKTVLLKLDVENGDKNFLPLRNLISDKNLVTIGKEPSIPSLSLDVSRNKNGEVIKTPISQFNSSRYWPLAILLKVSDSDGNGFVSMKNINFKYMQTAPEHGYCNTLEVNPKKPELYFYFKFNGYFGKGIIESLMQRNGNQWAMKILFMINNKKGDKNLQNDFDYETYVE